ncbi:MAG: hypothetical protein H6742_19620 [Alphaproteobacteria bacterium]|nr:hypothetical protein [Alphaproteobacteria bacterium]
MNTHLLPAVLCSLPLLAATGCAKSGAPPTNAPVTWPEGAFRMHAADSLTAPAALPELMGGYFDVHVLFAAAPVDGVPTLFVDAADVDDAPMACGLTTALPLQLSPDGGFTATAPEIPLIGEDDVPFLLRDVTLQGRVAPTQVELTSVQGKVDSAAFVGLLGSDDPDKLCSMVGGKIPCAPCVDGTDRCWTLTLVPTLELVPAFTPRGVADICADATCADRPWCGPNAAAP